MKRILAGIQRDNRFSPNNIGNDSAIFELTALSLKKRGYHVNEYTESNCPENLKEKYVFSMAREPKVLRMLQQMENQGAVVVNSGYGAANCYRSSMTHLLLQEGIPSPNSLILDTSHHSPDIFHPFGGRPFWMKRGDFHAIHKEDVSYVRNAEEGAEMLREYARRAIESVLVCEHIHGDLVKFYGVTGTDFFYWFYPSESGHSKFGNERINGSIRNLPFQPDMLRFVANKAAETLKIDIYGGDAIITPESAIYLIDVNDWPSFAPCRKPGAAAIAQRICQRIESPNTL